MFSSGRFSLSTMLGAAALGLFVAASPGASQASGQPDGAAPAASAPPAAHLNAEDIQKGRGLFNDWSCGACHTLADAGGSGHVGPSFDGDKGLSQAFVVDRVTNGQGAMPAFGGQLTDPEIALLATYIVQVAAK